ncbi:PLP-dependent aminotransferase family protein [Mesorhizobium sp. NPDC059054]|uniref:aminotransferase-like domain-containing protein n=1 Tax=Mesorhizobium sp. NPDC059054 TaxID=3346711 RepID=UPI0036A4F697
MRTSVEHELQTPVEPISLIRSTPPTPPWVGEALARTLGEIGASPKIESLMRYHTFRGSEDDRNVASRWLSERFGADAGIDRIIMTNGTQSALFLALRTAVGIGNHLLTEDISYYGLRRLAALLGITVSGIAMDSDGALPDAFDEACRTRRPRALFLQPTLHNPTSTVMSRTRRIALAEVARKHGVPIIEDDVYGSLPSIAPEPIAAIAPDICWFASGPAKCMGPGLRLGYLVAPSGAEAEKAVTAFDTISTWHANPLSAAIMSRWVGDGTLANIRNAVREEIVARQTIARQCLSHLSLATHPESVFLWMGLPASLDQASFLQRLSDDGVILRPGHMFFVDQSKSDNHIRVVLGSPETKDELVTALATLSRLLAELAGGSIESRG